MIAAAAAAFAALGVGSIRLRRWAPALMVVAAWNWLLVGLALAAFLALLLAGPLFPVAAFLLVPALVAGVVLPVAFLRVYRDPDVQHTCEAHDPRPSWTEQCPRSVLALSVSLGLAGVLALPMPFVAAVPLFGKTLAGGPAALMTIGAAAASLWLARALYRMEPSGWWGTLILIALAGASWAVSAVTLRTEELLGVLGLGDARLDELGFGAEPFAMRAWLAAVSVLLTVAMVGYLWRIRRYFAGGLSRRSAPPPAP
ncbi:MAG TPA: hypothetical protein VJS92_01945 [Candidatus Polarisedimenticolaceae bacterium]|nr:hypothetical protein [Candidatus Polarisedimenticolaceae bacterium]